MHWVAAVPLRIPEAGDMRLRDAARSLRNAPSRRFSIPDVESGRSTPRGPAALRFASETRASCARSSQAIAAAL